MRSVHDLGPLQWQITGLSPFQWQWERGGKPEGPWTADVSALPARVPGSVQGALRRAGLLPDWNMGLEHRACEWVENRHWLFEAILPDDWFRPGQRHVLACDGLDGNGWVFLNGREVGTFANAFLPQRFDLTPAVRAAGNRLQIVFGLSPRWLGQIGFTSRFTDWKPRFNYTWDWIARLVQVGIWDAIRLEVTDGTANLSAARCQPGFDHAAGVGSVRVWCDQAGDRGRVRLELRAGTELIAVHDAAASELRNGLSWNDLEVKPWWPNGMGKQVLYTLTCRLVGDNGGEGDSRTWRIGFRAIEWRSCAGAPAGADPWIYVVNGQAVFLQGVNWTPIRANFADVELAEYRRLAETYRDLGCNIVRVWGGAFLEKPVLYDLCDELGLLIWQEFPLSSSGIDNWPPEDAASIAALTAVAAAYIERRQHHAALLCWCGGNELQGALDGAKTGGGKPVDLSHQLMRAFADTVVRLDPGRRFLPSSSSGPLFYAHRAEYGKGLHWDVHGPWKGESVEYWQEDDSLFRSEVGAPGASPADIIRGFAGGLDILPGTAANPLWRRTSWWIEWPEFVAEQKREPKDLEEYVAWSQQRQAVFLARAAHACKSRFPRCGGFIVWMGHDCFPCTANTAILDLFGRPKPAALALAEVFHGPAGAAS
jgi:beta-mannosidase